MIIVEYIDGTADIKVLNYIKKYNLLDNYKNLKIVENFKLTNIYSDSNRNHFIFSKYRNYLFYFNGFSHKISILLDEQIDNEFAYVEEDDKEYTNAESILNFLEIDVYNNKNLVPFLSILLDVNAKKLEIDDLINDENKLNNVNIHKTK